MAMEDGSDGAAELELLRAQRARLASRLRTPWWYVAGVALTLAVACAIPIGSRHVRGAGIGIALLAIAMLLLLRHALIRVSGVGLSSRAAQYPSARPWSIGMAAVILANSAVEPLFLDRDLLTIAILIGVIAALVGTVCLLGQLRGIRRDLETGRAAT